MTVGCGAWRPGGGLLACAGLLIVLAVALAPKDSTAGPPTAHAAATPIQTDTTVAAQQDTTSRATDAAESIADEDPVDGDLDPVTDEQIEAMLDISLEELLEMTVTAASKKEESIFEAPLSVSVLSRQAIERAGARSIPEALRLLPGVIVREQTAGNYDVHIRGFDNVPPNLQLYSFSSTTMLVMIDGRVVYNHFMGGTFWDTLPIDIGDVDRIEVVRGPAAALYGPNGVTGVINIITRNLKEDGLSVTLGARQALTTEQRAANASIGYRHAGLSLALSGNYQHVARHRVQYFSFTLNQWVDRPTQLIRPLSGTPIDLVDLKHPEPKLGRRQLALNLSSDYRINDDIHFALAGGLQSSRAQKILVDDMATQLSTNDSLLQFVDLRAKVFGLTAQISYLAGDQDTPTGRDGPTNGMPEGVNKHAYDISVFDVAVEYVFEPIESLSLRPSASFRHAEYTGALMLEYNDAGERVTNPKAIPNIAGGLRVDYKPWENLRVIAAARVDAYTDREEENYYRVSGEINDVTARSPTPEIKQGQVFYPSYQLVLTYRPLEDVLVRGGYHRAQRSPFVVDSFYFTDFPPPTVLRGNKAVDLMTMDVGEIGVRARLADALSIDLEMFGAYAFNFMDIYARHSVPSRAVYLVQYDNLPTKAAQIGATLSVELALKPVSIRLFATVQETRLFSHAVNTMQIFEFDQDPFDSVNQINNKSHKATPHLYGGLVVDWQPLEGLQVNANFYYYTRHRFVRSDTTLGMLSSARYEQREFGVASKLLVNLNATYNIMQGIEIYLSGRNILDARSREFAWGDRVPATFLSGLRWSYTLN